MEPLDKLIYLESLALARYHTIVDIDRIGQLITIFQNVENEHQYAYVEMNESSYLLHIGTLYVNRDGEYFIDSPTHTAKLTKGLYRKIKTWIAKSPELTLNREAIITMASNRFFIYKLTN